MPARGDRSTCPYHEFKDLAFWSRSVVDAGQSLDPLVDAPFLIAPTDRVASAGSCFAQHIARNLERCGYTSFLTEMAPPSVPPDVAAAFGYGVFSARYGNIYTSRQLVQLVDRAYGRFEPRCSFWTDADGRVFDLLRPGVSPEGWRNDEEAAFDRAQHLAAVRRLCEETDLFVVTLGLTEAWESREDGTVYPVCPGCGVGRFDADLHVFHNFTYEEVVDDLLGFVARLRGVNPGVRVLFTVSPVPLVATASGNHVLTATTYSKAVLRTAVERVVRDCEGVGYFPAYEIITSPSNRGGYFAADLRSVTQQGVDHVMRVFFRHFAGREIPEPTPDLDAGAADALLREAEIAAEVACDEENLERTP